MFSKIMLITILALAVSQAQSVAPLRSVPTCAGQPNYYKVLGPVSKWSCLGGDRFPRSGIDDELHELTDQKQMLTAAGFSDGYTIEVEKFVEESDFVQTHDYEQGDIEIFMPTFMSPCDEAGYVTVKTAGSVQDWEVSPTHGLKIAHNTLDPVQSLTAHCSLPTSYVNIHYVSDFKMERIIAPPTKE